MTITSKFPGTCRRCKGPIGIGDVIEWERGLGAQHADVNLCNNYKAVGPAGTTIDLSPIVTFLRDAQEKGGLKSPKARFLAPDGTSELKIALADTRNPGGLWLKLNGAYFGKITKDGKPFGQLASDPIMQQLLLAISKDPADAAQKYGALTSKCSFCGLQLTDEASKILGYGPICARKWGLFHVAGGSKMLKDITDLMAASSNVEVSTDHQPHVEGETLGEAMQAIQDAVPSGDVVRVIHRSRVMLAKTVEVPRELWEAYNRDECSEADQDRMNDYMSKHGVYAGEDVEEVEDEWYDEVKPEQPS